MRLPLPRGAAARHRAATSPPYGGQSRGDSTQNSLPAGSARTTRCGPGPGRRRRRWPRAPSAGRPRRPGRRGGRGHVQVPAVLDHLGADLDGPNGARRRPAPPAWRSARGEHVPAAGRRPEPGQAAGSGASTTTAAHRPGAQRAAGIEDAALVALGSASTTHGTSCCPTSAGEAPAAMSRWTQVAWCSSERALRSRWIRFLPTLGRRQAEHEIRARCPAAPPPSRRPRVGDRPARGLGPEAGLGRHVGGVDHHGVHAGRHGVISTEKPPMVGGWLWT